MAEDLTTTDVIGKPPIKEETTLPIPWAFNSKLVSVILLWTSILSDASMQSSVSIDATIAIVAPKIQTFGLVNPEKSGKVTRFFKSSADWGTGRFTKCSFAISNDVPLNSSLSAIPATTATNAPGSIFNFLRTETLSQVSKMARETKVTIIAPGESALPRLAAYSERLKPSNIFW